MTEVNERHSMHEHFDREYKRYRAEGGRGEWQEIEGRECLVCLESRPAYCDRGRYLAKLEAFGEFAVEIDGADGWPRYYFDLDRAKLEVEAWLRRRDQWDAGLSVWVARLCKEDDE